MHSTSPEHDSWIRAQHDKYAQQVPMLPTGATHLDEPASRPKELDLTQPINDASHARAEWVGGANPPLICRQPGFDLPAVVNRPARGVHAPR